MTAISTRLTERLNIKHPILLAPMALTAGGKLAAEVTAAGGLGLIGGYGDAEFLNTAFRDAGNTRVGCGFITWSLAQQPDLLDLVMSHQPAAVMLSFGDPALFAAAIRDTGAVLICQCQTLDDVRAALDVGAEMVVAQGGEAGGHGATRGTLNFVPETADFLAANSPDTLLAAAGGIADGRGLAAAMILGADEVLVGTRFWAALESLAPEEHRQSAVPAGGDNTVKTSSVDVVRRKAWPPGYQIRVRRNAFTDRWHGREAELAANLEDETTRYSKAYARGDAENSAAVCGEAIGLINAIEPARTIVERMVVEARSLLDRQS